MIYREKMQTLLESLGTKLKTIQAISKGTLNIPSEDVNTIITQTLIITEKLENLVNSER